MELDFANAAQAQWRNSAPISAKSSATTSQKYRPDQSGHLDGLLTAQLHLSGPELPTDEGRLMPPCNRAS